MALKRCEEPARQCVQVHKQGGVSLAIAPRSPAGRRGTGGSTRALGDRFSVADTGIGIHQTSRGSSSSISAGTARRAGNTGHRLGLSDQP